MAKHITKSFGALGKLVRTSHTPGPGTSGCVSEFFHGSRHRKAQMRFFSKSTKRSQTNFL